MGILFQLTGIRTVQFIKNEVRGTFQAKLMLMANVGFLTENIIYHVYIKTLTKRRPASK